MSALELGFVAIPMEDPATGAAPSWSAMRRWATLAEDLAFDTVWVPDELLWSTTEGQPRGFWECLSLTGAIAASTDTIGIGTWVVSALHRNPGIAAKAAATLDEISNGRFIFGFGSGHAGRQGEAFGFPPDRIVSRYEESLAIVTSLLRHGEATLEGDYHSAVGQAFRPSGPRAGDIPLMLGGHGPRTMRLAAEHADIWSGYATKSSQPHAFEEMLAQLDRVCEETGRDPASLGRSIGVLITAPDVELEGTMAEDDPIAGSTAEITETLLRFDAMGCTRVELWVLGDIDEALPALAPVIEGVRNG